MKQKHILGLNRYTVGVLAVLIVAALAGAIFVATRDAAEAAPSQPATAQEAKARFSFAGASDWREGPSNSTSIALFYNPADCFVSAEYRPGSIDTAAALQKIQTDLASGGYTSTPGATTSATLQTTAGAKQYQLHQYTVAGTGTADKLYGGQSFGYLQVSDGYIKIEAYCITPDHLPATTAALQAIKFD